MEQFFLFKKGTSTESLILNKNIQIPST